MIRIHPAYSVKRWFMQALLHSSDSPMTSGGNATLLNHQIRGFFATAKPASESSIRTLSTTIPQQTGMTTDDWVKRWEDKQSVIRWQLNDVHPFLAKHAPSSKTHRRVLVPLAGKTVDLFWLLEKGFQVIGVEYCLSAIEDFFNQYIGRKNYAIEKRSSTCSIYRAEQNRLAMIACDMFAEELTPTLIGGHVSFVWDRGSLTALHPADHARYIAKLKQLSEVHTEYLISVFWHAGPPTMGPPFAISGDRLKELFPGDKIDQLDDVNAKTGLWADTAFEDFHERCFRINT